MLLKPFEYFIFKNAISKNIKITRNYLVAYKLLMRRPDLQIMVIGQNAKTRVINRKDFIAEFGIVTEDKERFFDLVNTVIKGYTNQLAVIAQTNFTGEEYRQHLNFV